jgi:cytochrome c553
LPSSSKSPARGKRGSLRGSPAARGAGRWLPALAGTIATAIAAPTPAQLEFFEQRIRPILAAECYECHGAEKQKGGLRLDSREGLRDGGDSGPALVAGDSAGSLLVGSITHADPAERMPKDRPQLPAAVIDDFRKWIDDGAPDPRDEARAAAPPPAADWAAVFQARRDWWSFKPLAKPPPPAGPAEHPVDRFLGVKLAELGLAPAAIAERPVLLRRATFALTGLPPTPEEIRDFLADQAPGAFERVVDRLLASPRFGERWARHWMDLTRFAETHGSEGDPEIPHAWRYRDYLIRAMNADVPWDQLIREHVAGDLLEKPRVDPQEGINESIIGPANLRLVEHGFQPIDTLDEQVKTVDNQIDVISKAFQGLTTSCARCHDHKFDPISQRDYFSLFGVLASSRPGQVAIDLPERLRVHRGELVRLKAAIHGGLADAWTRSAEELHRQMNGDGRPLPIPGDELAARIAAAERRIAEIERAARPVALAARSGPRESRPAAGPLAVWTFDKDAGDSLGGLPGELHGGAVVRDGRLILDGKGSFLRTPPLAADLAEKTLEAWVTVADPKQRAGGVITVESGDGRIFDSIVYAEESPRQWIAGSEFAVRSRNTGGAEESAPADQVVHLAIVYRADHGIAVYRNGEPYGAAYTPGGEGGKLRTFGAGDARVLLGMRHSGGGNPFFHGAIEEARLYNRALGAEEIARSFQSGPGEVPAEELAKAMTPEQRTAREREIAAILADSAELAARFPDYARRDAARRRQLAALQAAADDPAHPLYRWQRPRGKSRPAPAAEPRPAAFETFWEVGGKPREPWFALGINPPETLARPGGFAIEPDGDALLGGLLPAGVYSHLLSSKHHGIFTSPRFEITTGAISVLAVGGHGARVRLIPDNYPIGGDRIFPQATLDSSRPTWVRLDTAYRKGTMAHLEFVTAGDSLSRERARPGPGGRSFFGVSRVVFHEGAGPAETGPPDGIAILAETPEDFADEIRRELQAAIAAWRDGSLGDRQHALLDAFVRAGLLPTTLGELPELAPLVADYRKLEAEIPEPRRAPGVYETVGTDAPLMERGDHLKPAGTVPRGYLELVSNKPYATRRSGRLELAADLTKSDNPLTSRVMVNRLWHHLFGRGLVATVDNFGRLGEPPSHPELLDFLASRFQEQGWSAKEMIRFLITSDAWQRSSEASAEARETDPNNQWLSHARVRRLEGEAVRDSLLAISGRLDPAMYGPGADALAPPDQQQRRSVYLTIRRNALSPFLEVFDAPRPFTTLGRRDATNVPGQSLALLNDPFVIGQADRWAAALLATPESAGERVTRMFLQALGRAPSGREMELILAYLDELAREHGPDGERLVWRDLAQSIFNFKELIYLR